MAGFDVEQFVFRSNEPRWLAEQRERALDVLRAPSTADWFSDVLGELDLRRDPVEREPNDDVVEQARRLAAHGVVFCDLDTAVRDHADLVERHLGTVVAYDDNEFAALNAALWSGGAFVHVPPGVEVELPLQSVSLVESEPPAPFERTLIVVGAGARVSFLSGCSAPVYTSRSLHSAVVEVVAEPQARVTCTSIQNWSPNVHHVVTKRARAAAQAHVEWIDGNIGAGRAVDHTGVHLAGEGATGEVWSVSVAGDGRYRESNLEFVHAAPHTVSTVVSKTVSTSASTNRGDDPGSHRHHSEVRVVAGAVGARSSVACDTLDLGALSGAPGDSPSTVTRHIDVAEPDARLDHAATVSEMSDGQRFYPMSRGLSEEQAEALIVNGFVEPVTSRLPLEYSVEWTRLIELAVDGSVG